MADKKTTPTKPRPTVRMKPERIQQPKAARATKETTGKKAVKERG